MGSNNDSKLSTQVDSRLDDLFGGGEEEQAQSFENKEAESEVDSRLDNLFGDSNEESDNSPAPAQAPPSRPPVKKITPVSNESEENSPIKDLKSVILSLEWEISDQVMQRLTEEITKLEETCKADKIVVAFLQLLRSLGKYIQKKRADAHPESISLLNSVFESLETVMLSKNLSDAEKKKMLVTEVSKYKKLKVHIASGKTTPSKIQEPDIIQEAEPDVIEVHEPVHEAEPVRSSEKETGILAPREISGPVSSQDAIVNALNEINMTLKTEFEALRRDLRSFREGR